MGSPRTWNFFPVMLAVYGVVVVVPAIIVGGRNFLADREPSSLMIALAPIALLVLTVWVQTIYLRSRRRGPGTGGRGPSSRPGSTRHRSDATVTRRDDSPISDG